MIDLTESFEQMQGELAQARAHIATLEAQLAQNRQQAIANEYSFLNAILNTMDDALVSLSWPDRRPIYVSSAFEKVFGYPLQRFLDDPLFFQHVVHPDDLPTALISMQKVFDEGTVEIEQRIILPDGQVRWLQRRVWLNYDSEGRPIRLNDRAHDITLRKQAEEALRQNETYLRSLVDSHTAFHLRVDMAGNVSYYNKRYGEQFSWLGPSLIGLSALSMILPVDHAKVYQVVEQCVRQVGTPVQVELRKPTKTGDCMWTFWEFIAIQDNHGNVTDIQCVGFDITQQKQAEAKLRASEERYRHMFELHGLPKLIIDPTDGRIVDANPAAGQFYGYDGAVLQTLTIFDLALSPVDEMRAKMAKAMATGMLSCEFIHRAADGKPRNVEVFTGRVEIEGQPLLYSVITDITERERAKAALQEANNLLEARVVERTAELEKVKNRLEAIFDHSGDAILLLDIKHGIQQANFAFESLFALPTDRYLGLQLSHFFQPVQGVDLNTLIMEVAATHQKRHIEVQASRPDGSQFDVEMSIAPVNRSAQAVVSLVCIIRDITARKQAEAVIAEERNLLRSVIDVVPDYIYVKDRQHRIVLNNVAHARSLGVATPAAALGKSDRDLLPPAMAAKFWLDEEQIFQTGRSIVATEERSWNQDGREIWVLTTKVPLRSVKGDLIGLVGITHDISHIKAAEEALRQREQQLRESQKMLQLVLDTIPVAVFWKDRNSVYQGCNRLFAEDAGLQQTMDIVGVSDDDLPWLASEASAFKMNDLAVMESGVPTLAYEETLLTAPGRHLVIQTNKLPLRNEENTVIGVLGAYIDVTTRKQIEDALRSSEEKFRQFTESAPIAAIITDRNGRIVLVNHQAETLFGYPRHELIGEPIEILVPEEFRLSHPRHRLMYTSDPANQRSVMELSARHKDGTVFPIDLQLSYLDLAPTPLVMSFILDSTQRKQAEAALKMALMQEKEVGELKSRFVSMASHEFRTPLAAILATTETLSVYRTKLNDAQIDDRLGKIRQQVIHMKDIMEDVLQLARIQAGRIEFVPTHSDLHGFCLEIIEEFESQTHAASRICYSCKAVPVLLDFDRRLMRQVITNLISNALKYSPAEKSIELVLAQDGERVTLQVHDDGIGIPDTDQKRLFEPFHRAANVGMISGTGLGLSITKQAVELHNGTITLTSAVGLGTTFTTMFPKKTAIHDATLAG